MKFLRFFKHKVTLKKFAKQNQIVEAMYYIQNIELTDKEKQKIRKIIPKFFNVQNSNDLLLILEVGE